MIPFILAAVGGYLIGDSVKDDLKFDDGGEVPLDSIDVNDYKFTFETEFDYMQKTISSYYFDFDVVRVDATYPDGYRIDFPVKSREGLKEFINNAKKQGVKINKIYESNHFYDSPHQYLENGGEIRRFDRHEQMDSETRGEILDTINQFYLIDGFGNLRNYLYGLFDGYDYSQTDSFKDSMSKLKAKHPSLQTRIKKIYDKIDTYSFTKMADGGGIQNTDFEKSPFKKRNPRDVVSSGYVRIKNPHQMTKKELDYFLDILDEEDDNKAKEMLKKIEVKK